MSSDVHALSGAYAVDALDEEERAEFEKHLAVCETCRAEVDSLAEAAAALTMLTETTPPASLRTAVLADIATVRPFAPGAAVRPLRRRGGTPRRRGVTLGAAAAVVGVLSLGAGAVVWHPWQESAVTQSLAQRVIHADDVQILKQGLDGGANGGATVTVYRSASLGRAVVVARGLPAAPRGQVYELWLQDARGAMRPAGLMPRAADATVVVRGEAATARGLGITVEPAGGSPAPTSAPVALVAFADA